MTVPIFAWLGSIFTGLVFARNADKSATINSALAQKQHDTSLAIAQSQRQTQLEIAYRNLEQAGEIAERQQQTQLKLAYLNIAYQTGLEEKRQNFQRGLEMSRQQFQVRMERLRFGQQVTLEQARQTFQLKLNSLQYQQQQEIQGFIQSVNLAINQNNLDFQRWRAEQEIRLQKDLALYNRTTQFAIADHQRETAFILLQLSEIFQKTWPIKLFPVNLLESHNPNNRIPLRVFISPPEIEADRVERTPNQNFIEKRFSNELGNFLSLNYPLESSIRPIEFFDGVWKSKLFRGSASIKTIFEVLKSEPMLILESEVVGDYINLHLAYWNFGSENYFYRRFISRLPYRDILYNSAKARALKWKRDVRDKMLARGHSVEDINHEDDGNNVINLSILEKDDNLRRDEIKVERHYQVHKKDFDCLYKILANCHCLVAGWMADAHFLINYDIDPLLPELLHHLFSDESALPMNEVVQAVVSGYKELFKAISIEQSHRIPDLALKLAKGLANLPDKSFASEMVDISLKYKLNLVD